MPNSNQTNDFYNSEQITDTSRLGYWPAKINFFISQLKEINSLRGNLKILDIGCNDGELLQKYTPFGEVLGIDINKKALEECRKRNLKCVYGDIESIADSYKDYFDVVIAGDIIEHVFNTDSFLSNTRKVLKKDGVMLLTTPNLASFGRRLMLLFGKNPFIEYSTLLPTPELNVGHIRYYTRQNLFDQLADQKFKNVQISGDRINLLPFLYLPAFIARLLPNLSRHFHVYAEKR